MSNKIITSVAFTLAQHSTSKPNLQKRCIEYLKAAVAEGEASPVQEACLEDSILFNEAKSRKYGMLFGCNE